MALKHVDEELEVGVACIVALSEGYVFHGALDQGPEDVFFRTLVPGAEHHQSGVVVSSEAGPQVFYETENALRLSASTLTDAVEGAGCDW
jgi:hypothetical protein